VKLEKGNNLAGLVFAGPIPQVTITIHLIFALKFKMRWFPDEAGYSAEKVYTYINLPALMSNEDKNIGGSLTLDLRK